MNPKYLEFYIYAEDADAALEMAGNGADSEFKSVEDARKSFDVEYHTGKSLYHIIVQKVKE